MRAPIRAASEEFVPLTIFGYPVGVVPRRSPLETLRDLRARARDAERAGLASKVQSEVAAAAATAAASDALLEARNEVASARAVEARRVTLQGMTAADGQRLALWELAQRGRQAQLAADLAGTVDAHDRALRERASSAAAVRRADEQLERVQERVRNAEVRLLQAREAAREEELNEAALRRSWERSYK